MTAKPSSSIRFECPSCGGRVKVPPGQAGQKCCCPKCGAQIVAPGEPNGAATAASDRQRPAPQQTPWGSLEDDFFADSAPHAAPASAPEPAPAAPASTATPGQATPAGRPTSPAEAPAPREPADSPQADGLPNADRAPAAGAVGAEPRLEFGLECVLCGTRLYATLEHVGKRIKCPDCHSMVLVKPPQTPPKAAPVLEADDGEYRLSEPVEVPRGIHLPREDVRRGLDETAGAARPAAQSGKPPVDRQKLTGDIVRDAARDVLAKAEAQADEIERATPKLPAHPLTSGVLSFLFDAPAILRWVILTILGNIAVGSLIGASEMIHGGPFQQFMAVFLCVVLVAFAAVFALVGATCGVVIIQETASGAEKMEQWPGLSVGQWFGDGLYGVSSLSASVAVGAIPAMLVASPWVTALAGTVTGAALFPIFVVSALEEASPIGFASRLIWGSLQTASGLWTKFYLISAGLVIGAWVAASLMVACGFFAGIFFAAIVVALGMIYCRILGRLVWCLSEQEGDQEVAAAKKEV